MLGNLVLVPSPEVAEGPLGAGQVRIAVRAAGLNFRDVLNALGMVDDPRAAGPLGSEVAGVVTGVGPGVAGVAAGDRVMGVVPGGFGPVAVADHRMLAPVPAGWSFAAAASVPVAFATAWYALADLAALAGGESVLVHAGTGGVGMAAIQVARHLGARVFATAGPAKQHVLARLGVPAGQAGSSRDTGFAARFAAATGGRGVDVVLNSLAGDLTDAGLGLVAAGGRFVEMGKTDIRPAAWVAGRYPGVAYRAFDLMDAGPDRIGEILAGLAALFASGALDPLPVTCWDVRQAGEAFRYMAAARHVGKIVLTVPRPLDAAGTVVITGAGGLGREVARHLAAVHGARHLLLASRRGPDAPGTAELAADLGQHGTQVTAVACDLTDRAQVAALLAAVPAGRPVTGVIHTAAVLDDGLTGSQTPARVDRVLAPKADAAWHLHELTAGMDLAVFAVFSSLAGILGNAGQGGYAAANTFLDALIQDRRRRGLPGTSMAWGAWTTGTGLTGTLSAVDISRIERSPMPPMPLSQGLHLFDRALGSAQPVLGLARLNPRAWAGQDIPPLWRSLVGPPRRRAAAGAAHGPHDLGHQLTALPPAERGQVLTTLVRESAATVLGHAPGTRIDAGQPFSELGFDSLTAVELRNLLQARTGAEPAVQLCRVRLPDRRPRGGVSWRAMFEVLPSSLPSAGGGVLEAFGAGRR